MQMVNIIIFISASCGVIIYFTCCLRPMMQESAARGMPWRMYPVCCLGDYFERRLLRKRAEKDRLIALARQRTPSLLPPYAGRVCPSLLGPTGELFVFVEVPLMDATGEDHAQIATTVIVPPQARPFIEQCITDGSLWQVRCVPATPRDIRLSVTIMDPTGQSTSLQNWVESQARRWRPKPAVPAAPLTCQVFRPTPIVTAPRRGGVVYS